MTTSDVFEHWRAAHQEAEAAAKALHLKSMRAMDRMGEPPSQEEADQVRRLRQAADREFHAAMALLHTVVSALAPAPAGSGAARGGAPR